MTKQSAMTSGFQLDDIVSALFATAHAMRMELTFCIVLALLWVTGRISGVRVNNARAPSNKNNAQFAGKPRSAGTPAVGKPTSRPRPKMKPDEAVFGRKEFDESIPLVGNVSNSQLTDHAWLVPKITQLCRSEVQRALEMYRAAMAAGLDLRQLPSVECDNLFMSLLTAAIRVGQPNEALHLLQDLRQRGPGVPLALFYSATKICTAKQLFAECLAMYSFMAEDTTFEIDDKSVWSCLLFSAVEVKQFDQCSFFWKRLKALGTPSSKDYGNMARVASISGNWRLSLTLVEEMRDSGIEIDNVLYNTALATCVTADKVDQARALLDSIESIGGVADVITYNTLAKGYARAGRLDQCFEVYELMRQRGIAPSQVTYGILLDGCINENQVDRAADVADCMAREGCTMNTILCTTLIKGFARAGQLDRAMKVYYDQMSRGRGISPDLITFSILIKANCDAQRMEEALRLLESMLDLGLKPDEVVFNNLIAGCNKDLNVELGKRLYMDMIAAGVRPSNATFSILIRLYSQCKLLDEAVEMLSKEPAAHKVEPEPRLFAQLAQCCLRERQGRRAVEVYKLMVEHTLPTAAIHSSMLGMCVKLNMLDTGSEILGLAATARGRVDALDANHFLEAARRKRKTQVVETCLAAMQALGIAA